MRVISRFLMDLVNLNVQRDLVPILLIFFASFVMQLEKHVPTWENKIVSHVMTEITCYPQVLERMNALAIPFRMHRMFANLVT